MSSVPAKPSASVLLLRDHDGPPEVLLVRRNTKITFHGGAWVFPGGKVDSDDESGEDLDELTVARRAAIREVFEETGVNVQSEALQVYSHWTTPEHMPKRFATWFFVAVVAADTAVRIDHSEIVDYRWVSIEQALHQRAREEIELPAPAFVSLTKLREFVHAAAILEHLDGRPIDRFVPRIVKLDDGRCALYQEDAGYNALDLHAVGSRHRLVMEASGWYYIKD